MQMKGFTWAAQWLSSPLPQASRIARDEEDMKLIMSMLEGSWINPFKDEKQDLVCSSTNNLATPEIENDLHALGRGFRRDDILS